MPSMPGKSCSCRLWLCLHSIYSVAISAVDIVVAAVIGCCEPCFFVFVWVTSELPTLHQMMRYRTNLV